MHLLGLDADHHELHHDFLARPQFLRQCLNAVSDYHQHGLAPMYLSRSPCTRAARPSALHGCFCPWSLHFVGYQVHFDSVSALGLLTAGRYQVRSDVVSSKGVISY